MYLFKSVVCLFLVVSVSQCHDSETVLKNDKKDSSESGYSYNVEYFDKNQNKGYGYKVQVKEDDKKKKSWNVKQESPQTTTVTPLKNEKFKPSPRGPQIYIESTSGKIEHFADLTQRDTATKDYKAIPNENQYKSYSTSETLPEKLPEASPLTYSQSVQHNTKLTAPQFQKFSAEDGLTFPTKEYQSQLHNGPSEQVIHTTDKFNPKKTYFYSSNTKYFSEPIKSTQYINSDPSEQDTYATDRPTTKEYFYSPKNYQHPQYYSETIKPTQDVYNGAPEHVIYATETPEFNHYSTNDQSYTPENNKAFPEKSFKLNQQSYYSKDTQAYPFENSEVSPEKYLKAHELNQQSYYPKDTQAYPFENSEVSPEKYLKAHELNQQSYYPKDTQVYSFENSGVSPEKSLKAHELNQQSYYAKDIQAYSFENSEVSPEKSLKAHELNQQSYYAKDIQAYPFENSEVSPENSLKAQDLNQQSYYTKDTQSYPFENSKVLPEKSVKSLELNQESFYTKDAQVYPHENKVVSTENTLKTPILNYQSYYSTHQEHPQVYVPINHGVLPEKSLNSKYYQPAIVYSTRPQVKYEHTKPTQVESSQIKYETNEPVSHNYNYEKTYSSPSTVSSEIKLESPEQGFGHTHSEKGLYYSTKYPGVYSPSNQVHSTNNKEVIKYEYEQPQNENHAQLYASGLPDHGINDQSRYKQAEIPEIYGTNEKPSHYSSDVQYLPTQNQEQPQYASRAPYLSQNTYKTSIEAPTTEVAPNNYLVNQYIPEQSIYSSVPLNSNEYLPKIYSKPIQFDHPEYSAPKIEKYKPQYAPSYSETTLQRFPQTDATNPRSPKSFGYSDYYYMMPIQQQKYPYRYNNVNDQNMSVMYEIAQVSDKKKDPKVKMFVYEPRFEYSFENKAYKNAHGIQNQYKHEHAETFDFPAETEQSVVKQTYDNNYDQHFVAEDSKKQYGYKAMMY